jgi:hypothetical protein
MDIHFCVFGRRSEEMFTHSTFVIKHEEINEITLMLSELLGPADTVCFCVVYRSQNKQLCLYIALTEG